MTTRYRAQSASHNRPFTTERDQCLSAATLFALPQ